MLELIRLQCGTRRCRLLLSKYNVVLGSCSFGVPNLATCMSFDSGQEGAGRDNSNVVNLHCSTHFKHTSSLLHWNYSFFSHEYFCFSLLCQPNWRRWKRRRNVERGTSWTRAVRTSTKSLPSFPMMPRCPWWRRSTLPSSSWTRGGGKCGSPLPRKRYQR